MTARRRGLARLGAGSAAAGWWLARWPWQGATTRARAGRWLWYLVLVWCGWRIVPAHRGLLLVLLAVWPVVAWWAGRSTTTPPPDPATPSGGEEAGRGPADEEPLPAGEGITILPDPGGDPNRWVVKHH